MKHISKPKQIRILIAFLHWLCKDIHIADSTDFTKSIPYTCTLYVDRTEFTLKEEVLFQRGLTLKLEELKEILVVHSHSTKHAERQEISPYFLIQRFHEW